MNKQHGFIFCLISFLTTLNINAQDSSKQRRGITDFYIQNGFLANRSMGGSLNDFRKLAPESQILKNNFKGYNLYTNNNINPGFAFTMLLATDLRNRRTGKLNPNRQFRSGISYILQNGFTGNFHRQDRNTYDTINTPQGPVYFDSVRTSSLFMRYRSEQIRIDVSMIFKTNSAARWSIYGGIGISAGVSLNSSVEIYSYSNSYTQAKGAFTGYNYSQSSLYEEERENFKMKANYGATAYVPLGIDFRIGRKRPFWKRLHLYMEMRPGITMLSVPGFPVYVSGQFYNAGGLRVRF